jgi:hypothetical protein
MGKLGREMVNMRADTEIEIEERELLLIVKARFSKIAQSFKKRMLISGYSVTLPKGEDTIISLLLQRYPDGKEVELRVSSRGECFDANYNRVFQRGTSCAYDMPHKLLELDKLLSFAELYIQDRDYYEEIYKKNDRIIFRKIIYSNGTSASKPTVFAGRLRRYFGCTKQIVYPPQIK